MELAHRDRDFHVDAANRTTAPVCPWCGHAGQSPHSISMAFWRGTGLFVIRDIPAMACDGCKEQYLSDETILGLDRMRGEGLTADRLVEALMVPVYRFSSASGG